MSDFIDFSSKKKLLAANVLTAEQFSFIDGIKGLFTSSLHSSNQYMVLTLYQEKQTPKYSYLIADLNTKTVEQAQSVKTAKQKVREYFKNDTPVIAKAAPVSVPTNIPRPSCDEVDRYLTKWNTAADYYEPESVLKKLFTQTHPYNTMIDSIILKIAALNTVYNTYIYSVYPVAQHILSLGIDKRLCMGDETLVNEVMRVRYGAAKKTDHYSFATKYCSFHNPDAYPIYDSYVGKILQYYRDSEGFCSFRNIDLKDYPTFKRIIAEFRRHFGLEKYTTKELDQYLWQFGKDYF